MSGIWNLIAGAESAVMAASGGANAIYFARRAAGAGGARRVAASVLVGLFAGVALDGLSHLDGSLGGATAEVVRRAPLLVATIATTVLVRLGAGR